MIIGNIVTNMSIDADDFFEVYNFDNMGERDTTKPTLYIGFYPTKERFGKLNPLNKFLGDNQLWTFSRKENNKEMNRDIFLFKQFCYTYSVKDLKYIYISPTSTLTTLKKIIKNIQDNIQNMVALRGTKNMLYLYYKDYIIGMNYEILEMMGVNTKKLNKRIYLGCKSYHTFESMPMSLKNYSTHLESEMYACMGI